MNNLRLISRLIATCLLLALAGPIALRAAAGGDVKVPIPSPDERWSVLKDERRLAAPLQLGEAGALGAAAGVDALHYTLDLRFDSRTKVVSGSVTGRFEVITPGLATLVLNLYDNMTVSSVTLGSTPLSFTRGSNRLNVALDRPYAAGETVEVTVAYSGTPQSGGFGSFAWSKHGNDPVFASLSEPTYGPTWWPSVDDPADKATADMYFTVEPGLVAVSNGALLSAVVGSDNWTTYHWAESYPISTYLISIACSNYATFAHSYTPLGGGAPMEIRYWAYPESLADAQATFATVPGMVSIFASQFGEYPFLAEKYGFAFFTWGGGMEHQTATSVGAMLIDGTNRYEFLLAHETAHQWWGDAVTLHDWREVWLNEGFASWCEAVYAGEKNGGTAYRDYMLTMRDATFTGPVYNNPSPFSITVYDKGAWVLHMLRHVIGDVPFMDMLRGYQLKYQFANATTPVFQAEAESAYGGSLAWFFDEWVYSSTDRPNYQWGWTAADTGTGWVLHLRIDQTQAATQYRMPIDVRVTTAGGAESFVVWNDASTRDFALPVAGPPAAVALDPDTWILMNSSQVTPPDGDTDGVYDAADNCPGAPNPAQGDLDHDGLGDACDPDADGDGALNAADCAPLEAGAFALPPEVVYLDATEAGLAWTDVAPQCGSGVLYDMVRGDLLSLAATGVSGAACLLDAYGDLAFDDPDAPPLLGGFYYLVRGRNTCGKGTYGTGSSGTERLNDTCP